MSAQPSLFESLALSQRVSRLLLAILHDGRRPSAAELLLEVESKLGIGARWDLPAVLRQLADEAGLTRADREYFRAMLEDGSFDRAMRGADSPDRETVSTIDALLKQSQIYRSSDAFADMVQFMASFREYAPYNNILVRLQNPSCSFHATAKDWGVRFGRPAALGNGDTLLFVDGLRMDLAQRLLELLRAEGAEVSLSWRWSGFPTVTATCKPLVSPVAKAMRGAVVSPDLAPVTSDGKLIRKPVRDKLLEQAGWTTTSTLFPGGSYGAKRARSTRKAMRLAPRLPIAPS